MTTNNIGSPTFFKKNITISSLKTSKRKSLHHKPRIISIYRGKIFKIPRFSSIRDKCYYHIGRYILVYLHIQKDMPDNV